MRFKLSGGLLVIAVCLLAPVGQADSLQLKNGSLIKGRFMGGTENEVSFQVGSSVQKYKIADIASLTFDSEGMTSDAGSQPAGSPSSQPAAAATANAPTYVTLPAGTHISVRTIDGIDSTKNQVGDRFKASLEEPLVVNGSVLVPKGADVYGQLTQSKTSGTFTGKSELRLVLTAIMVNGQSVPVETGDYQLSGKSRGASTAKRTVGGAAVGTIIGAIAGGGKGAAIAAGVGGGAGAGSEIITKGDQVKVPSETLLDFTLQQDASIPTPQN